MHCLKQIGGILIIGRHEFEHRVLALGTTQKCGFHALKQAQATSVKRNRGLKISFPKGDHANMWRHKNLLLLQAWHLNAAGRKPSALDINTNAFQSASYSIVLRKEFHHASFLWIGKHSLGQEKRLDSRITNKTLPSRGVL